MKRTSIVKVALTALAMVSVSAMASSASSDFVPSRFAKTESALNAICYQKAEGPRVAMTSTAKLYDVNLRQLEKENPTCPKYGVRLSEVKSNYQERMAKRQ